MSGQGNFEHDYWRVVPSLSGDRPALTPGAVEDAEFRLLADNIPTACWIANGDGYIVWYNRRWHEYTGTTAEQMEGWGWQSVHDPDVLPSVIERWTASIATGEPFEMTFPLKGSDGVFRPFLTRVQPVQDNSGAVVRWYGVNTEIQALRESEERFRQVFENAAVGMIEIDASWNINDRTTPIATSPAAAKRSCWAPAAYPSRTPRMSRSAKARCARWRQERAAGLRLKSAISAPMATSSGCAAAFRG